MEQFNPESRTRQELMESRSRHFIAIDARAAKGHFAQPRLTREERQLVAAFGALSADLARREIDEPLADQPY